MYKFQDKISILNLLSSVLRTLVNISQQIISCTSFYDHLF